MALPTYVTQRPLRAFRPKDLAEHVANPGVQVARWVEQGRVLRLAPGYLVAVPDDRDASWRPGLETAAAGVAAAIYGIRDVALMGLSAARVHQAIPRALGVAVVAVPRQHRPITLHAGAQVIFVRRDVGRLDVRLEPLELGRALVTTPEQTVLDLAARPELGGEPEEAVEAATMLLDVSDPERLDELATEQRARAPLGRLRRDVDG